MKRKWLARTLTAAMSISMLMGMGTQAAESQGTEGEQITLTWAVFETDNYTADFWQHIIDTFEADNPDIKIEKVLMTGDSRPQFLKTMLAAGTMPDINVDPVDLAKTDGIYAEVPEELLSKFEDTAVAVVNGKKTLIPAYKAYRYQVYYNKNMFEQAGVEVPTTWDEFVDVCAKLQENEIVPLITAGASDIWATGEGTWESLVNPAAYAKYPDFNQQIVDGTLSWTDEVNVEALKAWQELVNAGYYHKGSMSFSYTQASAAFVDGEAAMMVDGAWTSATLDNTEGITEEDFGSFVLPTLTGDEAYFTMPGYWAVSETCENKEAAFRFCEYVLGGNEELYRYYLQADGTFSVTKEPVTYEMGPIQTQFIANYDGMEEVPEIGKVVGDPALPSGLVDFIDKSLQNIFTGADVESEVATWDAETQRLLENGN